MAALISSLPSLSFATLSFVHKNQELKHLFPIQSRPFPLNKRASLTVKSCLVTRKQFPDFFKFGASSSALQIESSATDGGRGEGSTDHVLAGGAGANSLHLYNEDVLLLKNMSVDVYRMSISWPRLFPSGKVSESSLNQEGLAFYQDLFAQLKYNDIEPNVTLFHFDLPKALLTSYGGTLDPQFVDDFNAYADFCFKTFGHQVKNWITINEPQVWCSELYKYGLDKDDEATFPYKAAYHILKAHATAVKTYRIIYQPTQGGKIGMAFNAEWFLPYSPCSRRDKSAARRAWDFTIGWFLDPLVFGHYPCSMTSIIDARHRLPTITAADEKLIKDSYDFIGINYYTSHYARYYAPSLSEPLSYTNDQRLKKEFERDQVPIGEPNDGLPFMCVYPEGLLEILKYLKDEYGNPLVYICENGYAYKRNDDKPLSETLQDQKRLGFIKAHLKYILKAMSSGCKVEGYFGWSLIDSAEFLSDQIRYGMNLTDYSNNYSRIPKSSADWLKRFLVADANEAVPM